MSTDQPDPIPAEDAPHAYIAVRRQNSINADVPEWERIAFVLPAHDTAELDHWHEHKPTFAFLPIRAEGDTGTRAIVEPALAPPVVELTRGAWLRNHLGAEVFTVEPARTALAPDLWTVDVVGVGLELATAEGLAACGYTLVTEETPDAQ